MQHDTNCTSSTCDHFYCSENLQCIWVKFGHTILMITAKWNSYWQVDYVNVYINIFTRAPKSLCHPVNNILHASTMVDKEKLTNPPVVSIWVDGKQGNNNYLKGEKDVNDGWPFTMCTYKCTANYSVHFWSIMKFEVWDFRIWSLRFELLILKSKISNVKFQDWPKQLPWLLWVAICKRNFIRVAFEYSLLGIRHK